MGQTVTKPYNEANPTCAVNQCLQQVVGTIDNNAVGQADACTSMFGSPSTSSLYVLRTQQPQLYLGSISCGRAADLE